MERPDDPVARTLRERAGVRLTWKRWMMLGVVLWIAACALQLNTARVRGTAGRAQLDAAVAVLDQDSVEIAKVLPLLEAGAADLDATHRSMSSPVLWPVRVVPVLGRQFAVLRAGAEGGASITARALEMVRVADGYRSEDSPRPTEIVDELAVSLRALEQAVIEADRGPDEGLVEPFRTLRADYADQVDELETEVTRLRTIVDGLEQFLASDLYLALGSNNAEMRLGAGMPLGIGELELDDGDIGFEGFQPSWSALPPAAIEVLDRDFADRWGFLSPTDDFRKLTYSARFDEVVGPQALEMWRAKTGDSPDGVMLVDPVALIALLRVVGPVEVDGQTLDADTALDYILKGQYQRYGERTDEVQSTREDALGAISAAAVAKFGEGGWDPVELLQSLRPLAGSRHIMMYSPDPVQQAAWRAGGIDGAVAADTIGVFLLNLGASKLDPYVSIDVEIETVSVTATPATPEARRDVRVEASLTIRNDADRTLSPFTLGTWEELGLSEPGDYNGRIALYLPASITAIELPDGTVTEVFGPDGPVIVAAWRVVLPARSTTTIDLSFDVPGGTEALHVLPSARSPAVEWSWNGAVFTDVVPTVVDPTP